MCRFRHWKHFGGEKEPAEEIVELLVVLVLEMDAKTALV